MAWSTKSTPIYLFILISKPHLLQVFFFFLGQIKTWNFGQVESIAKSVNPYNSHEAINKGHKILESRWKSLGKL